MFIAFKAMSGAGLSPKFSLTALVHGGKVMLILSPKESMENPGHLGLPTLGKTSSKYLQHTQLNPIFTLLQHWAEY